MRRHLRSIAKRTGDACRRCPLGVLAVSGMLGILLIDPGVPSANPLGNAITPRALLGLIGLAMLLAGGGVILWRRARPLGSILLGASVTLVAFSVLHHLRIESIRSFPFAAALRDGEPIEIRGRGWFSERPNPGERSTFGTLRLESVSIEGTEIPCRHEVPVWIAGRTGPFRYGQSVSFTGRLLPLEGARSPGGFDPAAFYYRESGSLARLEIREGDDLQIEPGLQGNPVVAMANRSRDFLERGLLAGVDSGDEPYARLVAAMALGARENSPEDLEEWFRLSGTMHIFAVSGLHVGILAGILLGILLAVGVPRRQAILLLIPLLLFYAVLTGLRPSAIRSAVMLSVFLGAFVVKERPRLPNLLGFAALLLLLFDTNQLFLPGFQLSFAVLLSILLLAGPLQRWLAGPWLTDPFVPRTLRGPVRRGKDRVATGLAAAFAISLVSWLGSLGLLMWHFQSYSPIGIVANLFLVPFVGVIVGIAVLSLFCYSLQLLPLTVALNQLNVTVATLLTSLAHFFAELPGAHRHSGRGLVEEPAPAVLTLDVMGTRGEGAILAGWPRSDGTPGYWMLDCGGNRTYQQEMLPLLRSRSINRLEAILLTHGDMGHIGAAPQILTQLRPSILFEGTGPNRSRIYPEIESARDQLAIHTVPLEAGMSMRPDPVTVIRVLAPFDSSAGRIADDRCLVLRIERGDWSVLLTGDIGFLVEKELLESGVQLESDVWIRGQHSETTSGLGAFARAIDPRVVISSESDFPASERIGAELRDTLSELGATLLTLDETGVVSVMIEGDSLRIRTRETEPREIRLDPERRPGP